MAGFAVQRFSGELPLLNPRKLPDSAASATQNCDLVASDLRAFRTSALIATFAPTTTRRSGFVFNHTQMFLWENDVDATYGPIQASEEVKNRVYIGAGWQSTPVWSNKEMGLPNPGESYYGPPIAWRKLGVPPGATSPIAVVSPVPSGTISSMTVVDGRMKVDCVFAHGLKTGDRVLIGGLNEDWADIRGNVFQIEPDDVNTDWFYLKNYDPAIHSGAQATPSGTGTWTQEYRAEDLEDRLYVFTYVTDQGEEGPPSEPSSLISLNESQTVTITTPTSPTVDGYLVSTKRIYRTIPTTAGGADYYFVAEIPVAQADYEDTLEEISLGEALPSLDWYPPPDNLTGLTVLPNGVMAGFVDRTLYLSEPYQPHAWPSSYTKQMDSAIVGIAAFGQSLVIATEEYPYVGTATDPLSMTFSKLDTMEPCISKRCCKSIGYGVVYPSPNGLIIVSPAGTKNVLQDIWGERDWRLLFEGAETFAEIHEGKYFLITKDAHGFIFDPTAESLEITYLWLDDAVSGLLVDRDEGRLFYLESAPSRRVYEFNPDSGLTFTPAIWQSKTFVMPYPVNLGAFQIFFDESAGSVSLEFYADGVLKHSATVTSQEPQRLPSGFLAREWYVKITTQVEVQAIYVAETIAELRGALSR